MFKTTGLYTSPYGNRNLTRSFAAPEKIAAARAAGWKRGQHVPMSLDRISIEVRPDGSVVGMNCWVDGDVAACILVHNDQEGFFRADASTSSFSGDTGRLIVSIMKEVVEGGSPIELLLGYLFLLMPALSQIVHEVYYDAVPSA